MEDLEASEEPWSLPETKQLAKILTDWSNTEVSDRALSFPETRQMSKFFIDWSKDNGSDQALLERNIREMEAHIRMKILSDDTFDLVYIGRLCQEIQTHQYHPRGCHEWRAPGASLPSPRDWPQIEASPNTGSGNTASTSSSSQFRSSNSGPVVRAQSPLPANSLFRKFDVHTLELEEAARRMGARSRRNSGCGFCKKNGEPISIYTSHRLHGEHGRVSCPYLRELVCEVCGATGDSAHTRTYCPRLKEKSDQAAAIPTLLKATRHQSDGKLRKKGGR